MAFLSTLTQDSGQARVIPFLTSGPPAQLARDVLTRLREWVHDHRDPVWTTALAQIAVRKSLFRNRKQLTVVWDFFLHSYGVLFAAVWNS